MPGAVEDPPDLVVDQLLGVAQLRAHIGHQRVARAVFARHIGLVLGDVGVLGAQLDDHLGRDGGVDAAGVATGLGDLLHLIVLCARFCGLHACGDQLVVEVGDLLVVDRHALRHRQIVGRTKILDRLLGRDHPRFQIVDLAAEPGGGDPRCVVFGADLLLEIGVRDRVGDGRGLLRRFRADIDVDEEGCALPGDLHSLLQDFHRSRTRGVLGVRPVTRLRCWQNSRLIGSSRPGAA